MTPTPTYIVTITYKDGRIESSIPLRKVHADWFAAMMRASHADIVTITVEAA